MEYRRKPIIWAVMVLSMLLLLVSNSASAAIFRYDGPYKGKVIDADTGAPIVGAVVLGEWSRINPNVAGWNTEFYDAVEVLTDQEGEFHIKGLGPLFFSNIDQIEIVIFKAGYEHLGHTSWGSLKIDYYLRKIIKWEGSKAIFPLKKWDIDQRKKRFGDYLVNVPEQKQRLLKQEIEKERNQIYK